MTLLRRCISSLPQGQTVKRSAATLRRTAVRRAADLKIQTGALKRSPRGEDLQISEILQPLLKGPLLLSCLRLLTPSAMR